MAPSSSAPTSGPVLAAVDASSYAVSVCDYAAWAASRLGAPLELVHVLDRHPETAPILDLSGSLGMEDREALLEELTTVDERRGRLAQERGRILLDDAKRRAGEAGVSQVDARMRNGALVETLVDLEAEVRLFVLGKRGKHASLAKGHLGGNLERVIRAVHRPVLVVPRRFTPVQRFLLAFDGSATTRKGVEKIAASPLRGLACHLLMVGSDTAEHREQLGWARTSMAAAGFDVTASLRPGEPEFVIGDYVRRESIDLLMMGAYGHSRIRHLIVGSTTTTVLRTCDVPILLLR